MEIIANGIQTVNANQNVQFSDTVVCGNCSILHENGSGLVTLRGFTNQCRARFKVTFGGNIAIPTGGTVEAITMAIAVNGEAIDSTAMIETPTAVEAYGNIFGAVFIDVPQGCCKTISVQNISAQAISVSNPNLIVERVA